MALGDFTYRLKAQSGDSTPHDELGLAGDLTGGTITLVDMGSGDHAWQFTGQATAAGPSKSVAGGTPGSGVTMAFRIRVPTYGTVNYDKILSYAQTSTHDHMYWGKEGTNGAFSSRFSNITGTLSVGASAIGTTIKTIVLRLKTSTTGGVDDVVSMWVEKAGRSGSTPDQESVNNTIGSYTLDTINAGAGNSCVIQVSDWVIWGEELSDADCAALADNGIRATLDVGGSETITLTPDPASVQVGSARTFTATRSAPAGAGGVTYNVSSDNPAVATVPTPQVLTEADSDLTFDATGVSVGTANITITNAADSSETDTVALTVTAVTTKRAKFLVHPDFASATGITIEVNEAPTGGALTGAKLGFATGIAAEATLESGQAVIKVNAADVGASALAAGTSVRAIFKGLAASGSALGSGAEAGSVVVATGTIIEE